METGPDMEGMCRWNPDCQRYQWQGAKNLIAGQTDGKDQIRYLGRTECQPQFSVCKGSTLFNR